MLEFKKIEITDKEKCEKYLKMRNFHFCEYSFVDLFIWSEHYHTEIAFSDEFLFIRMKSFPEGVVMYAAPIGVGNIKTAITSIRMDAEKNGVAFIMVSLSEQLVTEIEEISPETFHFKELRDSADYVYLAEKMISLAGKKLHSKRNFINRFKTNYEGRWVFEDITQQNIEQVLEYHEEWCHANGCADDDSFLGETCAIRRALSHFDELRLKGGLLKIDGKVIAYTFGAQSTDDMFVIQIEKADGSIAGAYQMINNEFAKKYCNEVLYINREEDLGLEGLRKAKLSYYPEMINMKYMAVLKK